MKLLHYIKNKNKNTVTISWGKSSILYISKDWKLGQWLFWFVATDIDMFLVVHANHSCIAQTSKCMLPSLDNLHLGCKFSWS